jgi:hypothetical protein
LSKSYRNDFESRGPTRFLSPEEEYARGLRRRPKGKQAFEEEDDEDLVDTDNTIVDQEEEE